MTKLLVLGWDGASHSHLHQIQPDLYTSMQHGGKLLPEDLYQGIPIDSGTAWTTITTGLTVEEHGFLSINNAVRSKKLLKATKAVCRHIPHRKLRTYMYYGSNKALNRRDRTPRSTDVPYPRVWDRINERSLAMEVPLTYPAWETDGIMLSGIPAPLEGSKPSATPLRYEEYRKEYRGYNYLPDKKTPLEAADQPNRDEYIDQVVQLNEQAFNVVERIHREEDDLELIFAVFPLIDDLLHILDPEEDWQQIEDAYRTIDRWSQQLIEAVDPDDTLILSDHGMMPAGQSLNPSLYPGVTMDHDPMNGVWASTHDFGLEEQQDVTPAICAYFGVEYHKERFEMRIPEKQETGATDDIQV